MILWSLWLRSQTPEVNKIEPVIFHKNALDVLAHQIAGVLMDKETITQNELIDI